MVSGPSGWTGQAVGRRGIRGKPVRSLPSRFFAEAGAELLEPRVGRGEPERPARLALLVGVVDVVVRRVDLDGSGEGVGLTPVLGAKAPQVHLPEVETRLAIDDPFGHRGAHPAGAGDPVGAESRGYIETANRGLAQQEFVVRGERFWSIDQFDDVAFFQRRDSRDGVL